MRCFEDDPVKQRSQQNDWHNKEHDLAAGSHRCSSNSGVAGGSVCSYEDRF